MNAWLQSSDLSAHDLSLDAAEAVRTLQTHDWAQEIRRQADRERSGLESCPAGIGLMRDDGQILHICPSGDSALVHYHRNVRLLGFLWSRKLVLTQPAFPSGSVPDLIRWFFEGNDQALERIA